MTPTSEVMEAVLGPLPEVMGALAAVHDAAWRAVDRDLLQLCRARIAMLLGNEGEASSVEIEPALVDALPDWPSSHLFTATQRACLAFTDQFVTDVASLTDEQAQAVAGELGGDGLASFVDALLVIEQRQRLRLAWTRILPGVTP